ncbi:MAG: hypothetical protein LW923_14740 [Betaproteobacteria bacterium]|nr:hypothetical protein [Betaproteobacteria bacterium]
MPLFRALPTSSLEGPQAVHSQRILSTLFSAALLVACGSGESSSPGGAPPVTPSPSACAPGARSLAGVAVGYNLNVLFWEGLYADPALLAAVRSLGAPMLRYPGGTESDYFHWNAGRPVESCRYSTCRTWDNLTLRPPALYQSFGGHTQGTPASLAALSGATGGAPLFVANMVTAGPDEMVAWLGAARAAGLDASRVELGNEPYFAQVEGTNNNAVVFPDAAANATSARALAQRLRASWPGLRLAQPAFVPRIDLATGQPDPRQDQRMLTWNEGILAAGAADYADAFALHFYPVLPPRGGASERDYLAELGTHAARYWRATRSAAQWRLLPAAKALWITEFNVSFANANELVGTWMHGLYMAQFALRALEDGRVELLIAHMLTGNPQWQTVVHPGRVPDVAPAAGYQSYALTAQGRALAAVAAALAGGQCGRTLASAELAGASDPERVASWLVTQGQVQRLVVVNADAAAVRVDLAGAGWHAGTGRVLSAAPLARISDPGLVSEASLSLAQPRLEVPPYSIAMIERTR